MTKKKKKPLKTRNFWTVNPVTKVIPDKKKYNRKKKHKKGVDNT